MAAPSTTDKAQARQLVALGDTKFAAGDFQAAFAAYHGADVIMGVPTTGLQVARAELALNRLVEARKTLGRVMAHPPRKGEPSVFAAAREQAGEMALSVDSRIPTLSVEVEGVPAGATPSVTVDGTRWTAEQLNKPQALNPGTHEIAVWAPGRPRVVQSLTLAEGKHETVHLVLQAATTQFALSPPVYAGIGVAGAGIIVGTITGALSLSKASEVTDQCFDGRICPRSVEETRDESIVLAHVSTASFAVACAGAVLGIIGLVLGGDEVNDAHLAPGWTVNGGGFQLQF